MDRLDRMDWLGRLGRLDKMVNTHMTCDDCLYVMDPMIDKNFTYQYILVCTYFKFRVICFYLHSILFSSDPDSFFPAQSLCWLRINIFRHILLDDFILNQAKFSIRHMPESPGPSFVAWVINNLNRDIMVL